MKLSDTTINLATALLIAGVAAFVSGLQTLSLEIEVPELLRSTFRIVVALIALTNITGFPKPTIQKNWENVFGDKFFPTKKLTTTQKRMLAGVMEAFGLLLTYADEATIRACGYGTILVMYGRGAMAQSLVAFERMLAAALGSATAAFLLTAEIQHQLLVATPEANPDVKVE